MHPQHHTQGLTDENTQYLTSSQIWKSHQGKIQVMKCRNRNMDQPFMTCQRKRAVENESECTGKAENWDNFGRWWNMQSYIPSLKERTFHSSRFSETVISTPAATDWKQREITDTNGAMSSLLWQWHLIFLTFFFYGDHCNLPKPNWYEFGGTDTSYRQITEGQSRCLSMDPVPPPPPTHTHLNRA